MKKILNPCFKLVLALLLYGTQAQAADNYNFTDSFTGPTSPFLEIDGEYSYVAGGLGRIASGPRNINRTIADEFLTKDFDAELTVSSSASTGFDIVFFGFGNALGGKNNDGELTEALMFRIHSASGTGQQVDIGFFGNGVTSNFGWVVLQKLRTFGQGWNPVAGDTFRISKSGDTISFSMLSDPGDSIDLSISDVESLASRSGHPPFSFDPDNSHIFFSNSTAGTVFHNLSVADTGVPPDADGDGVLDDSDLCANTAEGAIVNSLGCSGSQAVELVCPADDHYRNHGQYVSCVSHAVEEAIADGLLTDEEGEEIVSAAARSDVGKPAKSGKKK